MATIGGKTLQIFVTADLKKFNSGLNKAQGGLKGFASTMKSMVGPALIATAAAAGALAVKFGVDGVKAALDDEAAQKKLATTLLNVGLAHDTKAVEGYIYQLERSLGIADTELRPAYDRLVRALGDTEKANTALQLSLDVSAGSGKSLEAVTEALGKAYEGNIAGLSRLGAGIDAATLRSGDMEAITRKLSGTFAGQATASASTFQGQIGRLTTAADNLKEAFGQGMLDALGDSNTSTQALVDSMESLEPMIKAAGTASVDFAAGLLILSNRVANFGRETEDSNGSGLDLAATLYKLQLQLIPGASAALTFAGTITDVGSEARITSGALADMYKKTIAVGMAALASAGATTEAQQSLIDSAYDSGIAADQAAEKEKRLAPYFARRAELLALATAETKSLNTATGKMSEGTEELTKKQIKLIALNEDLAASYSDTADKLNTRMAKLNENLGILDTMQAKLSAGLDLASAFEGQFDDAGAATGVSLLEGFNKQIDQANYFGQVLTAIKAQGADQQLIDQIASLGPVTGAALATQLLDDGLVPTMTEKFAGVRESTAGLALGLVPGFVAAGIESGAAAVDGLATQLAKEGDRLTKLGKRIGKPVGAAFKAQLAKDVAEALANVEAAGSAARAGAIARAEAQQSAITDQQVAQAIANVIRRSDSRSGAVVRPVLT